MVVFRCIGIEMLDAIVNCTKLLDNVNDDAVSWSAYFCQAFVVLFVSLLPPRLLVFLCFYFCLSVCVLCFSLSLYVYFLLSFSCSLSLLALQAKNAPLEQSF